jgi:hypothetical protein
VGAHKTFRSMLWTCLRWMIGMGWAFLRSVQRRWWVLELMKGSKSWSIYIDGLFLARLPDVLGPA